MIAIIDYGVGNLRSVEKAFNFIGSEAVTTSDSELILKADRVVLPGVGAFADAMERLEQAKMIEVIKSAVKSGRPFLGICLGMQLLFDYSEEGGEEVKGLGILKGSIKQLPHDMGLKVPHMGWNSINIDDSCPLFEGLQQNPHVYFVHSYYLSAEEKKDVIATTNYGIDFDVAVGRERVFATQFHPEKSGDVGLQILRNFVSLV
ncbi:MAG: hisH [Clostridiales bacterium]|jgi:glutamine amidotransferase|nr:hisH [Clostridiales bacterium]